MKPLIIPIAEIIQKQLRLEVEIAELSLMYTRIKIWERRNDNKNF